jgi:steroid delta-isomerase-like uncharacterized protein
VQISSDVAAEANVEVVRQALSALNEQNTDQLLAVVAPDMVIHYAELPEPLAGRDIWLRGFEIMRAAFPDFRAHIDDVVSAGDRVALRVHITGTHSGEFPGIPASGRRISYVSHEFYRVDGGVVAEEWICSDMASLLGQLQ